MCKCELIVKITYVKNCAMMGIQATAGKRKLDAVVASGGVTASTNCDELSAVPAKMGRWSNSSNNNNNNSNNNNNNTTITISSSTFDQNEQQNVTTSSAITQSTISSSNSNSKSSNNSVIAISSTSSSSTTTSLMLPLQSSLVVPPSPPTSDDCIARLRAVAVPGEVTSSSTTTSTTSSSCSNWQQHQTMTTTCTSSLATSLLSDDLDDDDLDDYDDFSDDDKCGSDVPYSTIAPQGYQPAARYPDFTQYQNQRGSATTPPATYYNHTFDSTDPFQTQYLNRAAHAQQQQQQQLHQQRNSQYWSTTTSNTGYYNNTLSPPQQTIRCDENGKSYLELGSAVIPPTPPPLPRPPIRCCDGPTRWCNYPCYRQRRLAVLNLSMFKLARYRQCSDPSLHRSVLICNTLRLIEREMEAEGNQIAAYQHAQQQLQQMQQQNHLNEANPAYNNNTNSSNNSNTPTSTEYSSSNRLTPVADVNSSYEHNLRELNASGRATPFPTLTMDNDSGLGDEDTSRTINWSSVLSLASQTDLDPLNNELYTPIDDSSNLVRNIDDRLSSNSDEVLGHNLDQNQLMDEFLPTWNKTSSSNNSSSSSSSSSSNNSNCSSSSNSNSSTNNLTTTSSCSVNDNFRTEQYNNRFLGEGEWDTFMQVLVGGS